MSTSFTSRLRDAINLMVEGPSMKCSRTKSNCLFTPLYRNGKYEWAKVLDSDGTLLATRRVHDGEGVSPKDTVNLLMGAIIQSEDATSLTKPNPLGKAALLHVANGIWVDMQGNGRKRLDRAMVVFVLPEGAAHHDRKRFKVTRRNVLNASDIMPGVVTVQVPRGANTKEICDAVSTEVRPFLVGKGRPKSKR